MEETWDEPGTAPGARDQAMEASCWCHACCRCCQPPDPSERGSDRHHGPSWCARGLAQWLVPIKRRAWCVLGHLWHGRGAPSIARWMAEEMGSGWEGGQAAGRDRIGLLALHSHPPGCRGCHCPHAVPTEGVLRNHHQPTLRFAPSPHGSLEAGPAPWACSRGKGICISAFRQAFIPWSI